MIKGALLRARNGEKLSQLRKEFGQIHNWNKQFAVFVSGDSEMLVSRPKNQDSQNVDAVTVKRITYLERVFSDLLVGHVPDDCPSTWAHHWKWKRK